VPLNLSKDDAAALKKLLARWKLDPVAFVLEVFGPGYERETGKPLVVDRWQEKSLRAMVPHKPGSCGQECDGQAHRCLADKACKGPGKTAKLAWVGWWRLLCAGKRHRGAAISITGGNLRSNLWPELSVWQSYSPLLMQEFEHKGETITSRDHPKTCWLQQRAFQMEASREAQAESLAGLHDENVTILLDEVGSFPQGVIDAALAIFNTLGQDCLIAAAGNATDQDGALHAMCTTYARRWYIVTITGDPDDPDRSPRIDEVEARRMIAERGRTDPVVMVNLLGQFPPKGGSKLLGSNEVEIAMRRNVPPRMYEYEPLVWGLDVAGEGLDPDEAVLYGRKGAVLFRPERWHNIPTDDLAGRVALKYHQARREGRAPKRIFVDKGGSGRGCYDLLRTLISKAVVIGVDFGSNALDEVRYADRRSEIYCLAAIWTREHGSLPDVPELRRDLTAPNLGTESSSKGTRYLLESKKVMKKRGCPSPDHGDAFALTFTMPVLPDTAEEIAAQTGSVLPAQTVNPFDILGGRR
jgi:phage terminase large subunit